MPARKEMPSTLKRSPKQAQQTWEKTHDSAVRTYGEGERSHRTAFASLKHSYEKVGDQWEPKAERGPSDAQAAKSRPRPGPTGEGIDVTASRKHLYDVAKTLDIKGRSTMNKAELVAAIKKANRAATARARAQARKR